ncbi:hypothetical protein TNCV_5117141 [Trichonephila clavipes]|nr:hypothetical protein TNCV_5117141 [Trichonephila clavipes]
MWTTPELVPPLLTTTPQHQREDIPALDRCSVHRCPTRIEEVIDCGMEINLEMDTDDVRELLVFYNQTLTTDELIEMHEKGRGIEELESLDPVQSEGLRLVEEVLQIFGNVGSNEEPFPFNKTRNK